MFLLEQCENKVAEQSGFGFDRKKIKAYEDIIEEIRTKLSE